MGIASAITPIKGHRCATELVSLLNVVCAACRDSIGSHTAESLLDCQKSLADEQERQNELTRLDNQSHGGQPIEATCITTPARALR